MSADTAAGQGATPSELRGPDPFAGNVRDRITGRAAGDGRGVARSRYLGQDEGEGGVEAETGVRAGAGSMTGVGLQAGTGGRSVNEARAPEPPPALAKPPAPAAPAGRPAPPLILAQIPDPDPTDPPLRPHDLGRIFLAGHRGMVGAALARRLHAEGVPQDALLTAPRAALDLTDQAAVRAFFAAARPDTVILAAARVGGILANDSFPADFLYENLMIEANVIHAAHAAGVERLLFLGSSCIYPRDAPQPMAEEALLTGPLEPTNAPYAIAKIAGIKLCESYNRQHGRDYRSVMPTNLYGPGDNFHPENSHVLPALIRRFHEARAAGHPTVTLWGTGTPRREFLHVDDMAAACLHVLGLPRAVYAAHTAPDRSHLNVGTGEDLTIRALAELVAETVGYAGRIETDPAKPDGTPRKLLDTTRLTTLGWRPAIPLKTGLASTYRWYREHHAAARL